MPSGVYDRKKDATQRFVEKFTILDNGCWKWTAGKISTGYGSFATDGKRVLAHRWSYERYVADIPAGMQIDHLCRNRDCVNPDHMEVVTNKENTIRGNAGLTCTIRAILKTHCKRGHLITKENTKMITNIDSANHVCSNYKRRQTLEIEKSALMIKENEGRYKNK